MTALAADKNWISKDGKLRSFPVATATTIYKGSMVCINSSGYLVPAADTSGYSNVMGIADEQVVNAGANGAKNCRVVRGRLVLMTAVSITQGMVGDVMYVVDDATVDDVAGVSNGIRAGVLEAYVSSTSGWVYFDVPLLPAGTIGTSDLGTGAVTAVKLSATLKKGFIPLDITTLKLTSGNAIINTSEGGLPDGNTAPILQRINGATDKALRLTFAATVVTEVQFPPIPKPPDLDGASDLTVHLLVGKDGNTDTTANIDVQVFDGIGDTECGGATAAITETTGLNEKSVTVLAADLGDHPGVLNIALVPSAHANDAIYVYGAWLEYTRA